MIRGFSSPEQFVETLHANLSPTTPIQSPEYLFGRTKQLGQIEQALYSPGQSIFIYGDRGVGKTSIAMTIVRMRQSSSRPPVIVACTPSTTFSRIIGDVVLALQPLDESGSVTWKGKVGVTHASGVGGNVELERTKKSEPTPSTDLDLNDAVSLLLRAAKDLKDSFVLVDEFDRIEDEAERTQFADFIKQIGDQTIPIQFIFCGVAESLDKLLGAHGSAYRYLEAVEVPRLGFDARFEIIDKASKAFAVEIEERLRLRIAAISDGFPYYIHRVCEKLFWQMFTDPLPVSTATPVHYKEAISQSVSAMEPHLRTQYDNATQRTGEGYEDVLWAMADHSDLIRRTDQIYASYGKLFGDHPNPLDRGSVVSRLSALKKSGILASDRVGFYYFRESMMRGYVRLRAEHAGYELATDFASAPTTVATFRQRGARRSRGGVRPSTWRKTEIPTGE